MDALVAFGDDGVDAEETRAFGGPVARGTGAVLFAGEDDEGSAVGLISLGSVENRHFLVGGQVASEAAFDIDQFVAQADVGEGAADHDFVIAAARAIGVEVGGLDASFLQIFSGRAVFLDGAGGRNVVGGDAVAKDGENARAFQFFDRRRLELHLVEVGSPADVSGVFLPGVGLTFGDGQAAPAIVSGENLGITLGKHFRGDGVVD